jgi:hypothetical protein
MITLGYQLSGETTPDPQGTPVVALIGVVL